MKNEKYAKIMDALELIHKENVALGRMYILLAGGEDMHADVLEHQWNKAFEIIRKDVEQ